MSDTVPATEPVINPAAFDPDAFMTKLLGEFDKRTNAMDKKLNTIAQKFDAPKPVEPKPGEPTAEPKPGEAEPLKEARNIAELNAQLTAMNRRMESLTKENDTVKQEREAERQARLESERLGAIDTVLSQIEFASPKARQQFRDAYSAKVERDEDGALIVRTEKGEPLPYNTFLTAEAESSPHFLAPAGNRGAGAPGGRKSFGGPKIDISNMSAAEISKLPGDQQAGLWSEVASVLANSR